MKTYWTSKNGCAHTDKNGADMGKEKFKLKLKVEIASNGQFIVSDNLLYDHGVGGSLEECLKDYVETLVERSRFEDGSSLKKQQKLLKKYLRIYLK